MKRLFESLSTNQFPKGTKIKIRKDPCRKSFVQITMPDGAELIPFVISDVQTEEILRKFIKNGIFAMDPSSEGIRDDSGRISSPAYNSFNDIINGKINLK